MKLWSGRFTKQTDKLTEDFNASIAFDSRMYVQDIRGSMAHAAMLAKQGIISREEGENIMAALQEIQSEIENGQLEFTVEAEDIHMNIETFLTARIGDTGKKLHTARSRNDQVALDIRLYLNDEIIKIRQLLLELEETLLKIAGEHLHTVMPGYTHMQKAQPITLAHHLLAYFEMFRRDVERLDDCRKRVAAMPLGSGALAATGFNLDREYVREQLGFDYITRNSLDGVSDRDFAIEFCSFASILMMHLSRFSEEIILWATDEFAFVQLDDGFSTGSSIMPQKKNPDIAELVRGKTGRVYGDLITLLTLMKALPLAYNKDMQEDKEALFDALDTVKKCLMVFTPLLQTTRFQKEKMAQEARGGFTNATDLADYLVEKGMPFRDAHAVVGQAVLYCLENQQVLEEIDLETFKQFSSKIDADVYQNLDIANCVAKRQIPGGPAPQTVSRALAEAAAWLKEMQNAHK
ncbi:Argininosuccinate lyase [Syntrophomonas zehnderi OL-4]|uniref:Argininosuccinate lyase n=1 Tax=Syntrophomonas zehnderi OL-4 TaxID=690567 RepID=A0A0E4C7M3_9FIRM|nr:argininosuccinate lyase [Syntrophomonas zehnderi]CFX06226.1 Argininosuccinate lyase [Syntrophomonas zehnderi OL-4]CFX33501.1 Argininosuccinate lyase [Syntrophomonas zehnderi OL-4]